MSIEPNGKKCIFCNEELDGMCVIWEHYISLCLTKQIYAHPECYHKHPIKKIRVYEVIDYNLPITEDNVTTIDYELYMGRSKYFWIGEIS